MVLDFLGKDSIRYCNKVPVEKKFLRAYKLIYGKQTALRMIFLIDSILVSKWEHLQDLMEGLTAKVAQI